MPASVTIYNDSKSATDLMVTIVPGHSKAEMEVKLVPAVGEGGEPCMIDLERDDIMLIKRIA